MAGTASVIPYMDVPWALWAAPALAIVVALLVLWSYRRRARRLRRLASTELLARLVPPASTRAPWVRALLQFAAVLCAGIAFAGPRWGTEQTLERGSGVDMVLALDASLSMLATDARPNRLERMKEEARRLLALSTGDRIGLLAFAGRSYILTPLTVDRGALELFLDNLDPSVVGQAGSSLSRAIRQGTDLLVATQTTSDRALVIMSDGEAFEPVEEVTAAAAHAAEAGVTVIAVGFGTEKGSTIPVRTAQGTQSKRDENGQIVTTRYTPELLKDAVTAAHGVFIDAAATDKAVRIRGALSLLRRQARATESETARRARFQLFLIPALLLVMLDSMLGTRRGRRPSAPAAATATALALCLLLTPASLRAETGDTADQLYQSARYPEAAAAYQREIQEHADSPRLEFNLGTSLLQAGQLDDAIAALERAATTATSDDLRYNALYNLGLAYLRQARDAKSSEATGAYASSAEAYKRALQLRPSEVAAKWNYELASQEKSKSSGGGANQQQNQQQQEKQRQSSALDKRQAEQLLSSAQREERDVQAKKQRENQPERPPAGKDW
ncbi:MAG TPA: VWA domain-containing protein [Gemmatimonadaceae bacterium]